MSDEFAVGRASSSSDFESPPAALTNSVDSLHVGQIRPADKVGAVQSQPDQNSLEFPTSNTNGTASNAVGTTNSATFPPPKTDKPRPHVCTTCTRSFARLEHLKRHERSHTKEKPFECPECTRCFARRDLLLRHQQKLHLTTTPSSRSRGGRRESTSAIGPNPSGRIRKNSTTTGGINGASPNSQAPGAGRPRANTISHIDAPTLGMLAAANRQQFQTHQNSDPELLAAAMGFQKNSALHRKEPADNMNQFDFRGIAPAASMPHGNAHNLPRLNTQGLNIDDGSGLRTAPPGIVGNAGLGFDHVFGAHGSTINPAQLQLDEGSRSVPPMSLQSRHYSQVIPPPVLMEEDDSFEWLRGFQTQMNFNGNDNAIAASSPSAMSNGSQNGFQDIGQPVGSDQPSNMSSHLWPQNLMQTQMAANGQPPLQMDPNLSVFQNDFGVPGTAFSQEGALSGSAGLDNHFYPSPSPIPAFNGNNGMMHMSPSLNPPTTLSSGGTSISSSSINGSGALSSVTSASAETLTEQTRQALMLSLSQPSVFGHGHRQFSQPNVSSPLSPRDSNKAANGTSILPNLPDLQRFVSAYIQYFHPHFPFLHIPTLSFDSPAYTMNLHGQGTSGIVGGGGCLILSMAAIGALYEFDRAASKDLFDAAKKMIQLYLEERRKADIASNAAPASQKNGTADQSTAQNTPVWLVQAMLLNVVYGHNCGDQIAGDIASTHCSALVSLARAANLVRPMDDGNSDIGNDFVKIEKNGVNHGSNSAEEVHFNDPWGGNNMQQDDGYHKQWLRWVASEERKRTLFAIFHMSSLLVSAYNHAPALMNSEIHLALPCDEELWSAESATVWAARGGEDADKQQSIQFADALTTLLMASQKQHEHQHGMNYNQPFGSSIPLTELPHSDLKPSTFGCLVLINALHNYIWETRQRHCGRQWTAQETEAMHAHIEPALRAWQAAWASNPLHSLERPNPYGMGPLSADSIPLLDLAYVRLFVNLGTSKTLVWQRDFETMAEELAHGQEIIEHAEDGMANGPSVSLDTSSVTQNGHARPMSTHALASPPESMQIDSDPMSTSQSRDQHSSRRERQLRKAAFYAADSLSMSDKLGVTLVDFTSRELPVQSAICTFDCAQVLAEWVATVQERVGRYLGILGKDHIDYAQVPAIMLLEDEDCRLLERINDILKKAEAKMTFAFNGLDSEGYMLASRNLPSVNNKGFGSNILMVTAYMFDRAAVWPVLSSIAEGLEIQATHMSKRAESSVSR